MLPSRILTPKDYMQIAVQVGMENLGKTGTNPSVGAVIVQGNLFATGVTSFGGIPHAEVNAIENAKKIGINLEKSTLFVTLEPCSHYGRTPPCAKAIVEAKIPNVFFGMYDPDLRVNGNGVKFLRENGVNVEFLPIDTIAKLHGGYSTFKTKNRPFVTLKIASSLDGKIALANGESKWITSQNARRYTNFLRSKFDGILVGANTVRTDLPKLDCRIEGLEMFSPKKFVASRNIASTQNFDGYINVKGAIEEILLQIKENGVQNLLIEGGANLITQFLKENLFDELILVQAPIFLGNDSKNAVESLELNQFPPINFFLKHQKDFDGNLIRVFSNVSS